MNSILFITLPIPFLFTLPSTVFRLMYLLYTSKKKKTHSFFTEYCFSCLSRTMLFSLQRVVQFSSPKILIADDARTLTRPWPRAAAMCVYSGSPLGSFQSQTGTGHSAVECRQHGNQIRKRRDHLLVSADELNSWKSHQLSVTHLARLIGWALFVYMLYILNLIMIGLPLKLKLRNFKLDSYSWTLLNSHQMCKN